MISRRAGSFTNTFSSFLADLRTRRRRLPRRSRAQKRGSNIPAQSPERLEAKALLSPLTLAGDVNSAGSVTLTASDTAAAGDDLTIGAFTVESTGDMVTLNAGDNALLANTSVVSAATTITINLDDGDADGGVGSNSVLDGALNATSVAINGGPDDDVIGLGALAYATSPVTVDGAAGTSNQLNPDVTGVVNSTLILNGSTSGVIRSDNQQDVTFSNIQSVNAQNGNFAAAGLDLNLLADGNNASTDTILLESDGSGGITMSVNSVEIATVTQADFSAIVITGSNDSDQLIIDHSQGIIGLPITYAGGGGAGEDSLSVIGTGSTNAIYTPDAATTGSGTIAVDGGADTITFTGLEPVDISGMATATLTLPGANDVLAVQDGTAFTNAGQGAIRVSGSSAGVPIETVAFFNNTTVVIDTTAVDGDDTITVDTISVAHGNGSLSILTGGTTADGDAINLNGSVTTADNQTYDNAAVTLGADVVLTSTSSGMISFVDATIDGAQLLTVDTTGNVSFGGAIGSNIALTGLTTDTGGTVTVPAGITTSGMQTYNDTVTLATDTVLTGSVIRFNDDVEGSTTGAESLNIVGDLILGDGAGDYIGRATPLGHLSVSGTTTINATPVSPPTIATSDADGETGDQIYTGAVILASGADTTLTADGGDVTFQSTIDGPASLTVNSSDTTTFAGVVGGSTPLTSVTTDAGGSTAINADVDTTGGQTFNDAVVVGASIALTGQAVDVNNTVNLGANTLSISATDSGNRITGDISGTGGLNYDGGGSGTLFLDGTNTYDGMTNVTMGTLVIGDSNGLGTTVGNTAVSDTGTLRLDGSLAVAEPLALAGTVEVTSGSTAVLSGDITISGGSSEFDLNSSAALTVSGVISGTDGFSKTGDGTLTLSGTNTFTGPVLLSAGTVVVDGSTAVGADFGVQSGATLSGEGTIAGMVTIAGSGTVAPSGSTAVLGTGDFLLQSGADLNIDIAGIVTPGTDYDQVSVSGTVTLAGNLNITDTSSATPTTGDTIVLISNDGTDAVSGTFSGLAPGSAVTLNGNIWRLLYDGGDGNDVVLEFTPAEISVTDVSLAEGDSGTTDFSFDVTLNSPVGGSFSVGWSTSDNSATTADGDYTGNFGNLSFNGITAGETQTVTITVTGDETTELNESFFLNLTNIIAGTNSATPIIADSQATGTISNDDTATLSIDDVTLQEGNSGTTAFTFTVTLDGDVDSAFTVNFATGNDSAIAGSDYTAGIGQLNFTGNSGETQTVTIDVTGETDEEVDETFLVNLSGVSAGGRNVTISDATGIGTIIDDDRIAVELSADASAGSESGGTVVTLTATAATAVASDQTFDLSVTGTGVTAADYLLSNATITIPGGSDTGTVTLTVQDDAIVEVLETATVSLANPSSGVRVGTTGSVDIAISDNDAAAFSINDVSLNEGDSGTAQLIFTVTLDNAVDTAVDVDFATADGTAEAGTDFAAANGTLNFAGNAGETMSVVVDLTGDEVVELDEIFAVNLSGVASSGRNVTIGDSQGEGTITNDDTAVLTINDVTQAEGDSGTTAFVFTVTLDAAVDSAFTIAADTADNTAVAAGDYAAVTGGSVGFSGSAGETQSFTVNVSGDTQVEADESFFVNLSSVAAGGRNVTIGDAQGIGTISNDDAGVPVNLSVDTSAGTEAGSTVVTLTVTADAAVTGDQTVDISVAGTGVTTDDYTLSSATVTIPDGQATGTATFTVNDDAVVELPETATISLTNPSIGITAGSTVSQDVNISDNDAATLAIDDVTLAEGNSGTTAFTFTVTLNNAVDTSFTVDFASADGTATSADSDFAASSGSSLTFAGTAGETQQLTILANGDAKVELDETFLVNLTNIVAAGRNVTFADSQGLGTITNDDAATLAIGDVTMAEGNSGTTDFTFTVTLDAEVDVALTVDYATADGTATAGSDYTANTGTTLAFSGTAGETETFTVSVTGDAVAEADESFLVNLSGLAATGRNVTLADAQAAGTITDDDGIPVNLAVSTSSGTETDGTVVTLTVTAASAVSGNQTVDLMVSGTDVTQSDYVLSTSTVTINDGETQGTATFTVANDVTAEALETAVIQLVNPSVGISLGTTTSQTVTITDDDTASISISDAVLSEGDAGSTMITFTVVLDSAVDTGVSVNYATADDTAAAGTDYTAASGTLNFAGTVGESQLIQIQVTEDDVVELDETFLVNLSGLASSGRAVTLADAQGQGTITNDDSASLSISDVTMAEGDSGTTSFDFVVTLSGAVETAISVDYATSDATATTTDVDYLVASGTLNFSGSAGETQTITVLVNGDTTPETDETFLVSLSSLMAGGRNVSVSDSEAVGTISDDDGIPVSLGVSSSAGTEADTTQITVVAVASSVVSGDQTVEIVVSGTGITSGDYTLGSTTITIPDGQSIGTTTFNIVDDAVVEADETAVLTLTNPSVGVSLGAGVMQQVTITSDDTASVSIDDVTMSEGNSGTTTFTFTVTLDSEVSGGFTVDYATADDSATVADSDYASASGSLTFVGTAGETQTITVNVTGDTNAESTETFFVNLSNLSGTTQSVTISDAQGLGTITTDDNLTVTLSADVTAGTEAAQTAVTLTATASAAVTGDQTVDISVTGTDITSGDYTLSAATITIPDGQTTGTVTFTIVDDNLLESTETATLTISNPSAGISLGTMVSQDVSITDNSRVTLDPVAAFPGVRPTLTWQAVTGAARYEIWFSRITPATSRIFSETDLTSTSYTPPVDLDPAYYRYWVRAFDAQGNPARWSVDQSFEVQPNLTSPLNPTFNARPEFTWEAVPFATAYQIFVRTRQGDIIETDITGTSWTPTADLPTGPIRWWIRATDSIGNRGWSQVGLTNVDRRTTVTGPSSPTSDTTPTISWQQVDGAGRYILHVQNLDTSEVVIREDQLTATAYTPSAGLAAGNYRVWVKAIDGSTNAFTDSFWSRPLDFTITGVAPDSTIDNAERVDEVLGSVEVALAQIAATPEPTGANAEVPSVSRDVVRIADDAPASDRASAGADQPQHVAEPGLLDLVMSQPVVLAAMIDES